MVSLSGSSRASGARQGGIAFFSESLNSYNEDEPLLDAGMPVLPQAHRESVGRWMTQEVKKFRPIHTLRAIMLAMFLYMSLVISAFLLPHYCTRRKCGGQEGTSLVLYVHGGLWFLLSLVHLYLCAEHRASLLHGYFSFHLETRTLKRLPLLFNSAGNAVCVVVVQVVGAVCQTGEDRCGPVPRVSYLQSLITLEAALALIALTVYLVKTLHFNRAKEVPDFLRLTTTHNSDPLQSQIGFSESFDMQRWALEQCWSEIYEQRQGCGHLLEHRHHLTHRLQQLCRDNPTLSIN